jgi:hypothetical protein
MQSESERAGDVLELSQAGLKNLLALLEGLPLRLDTLNGARCNKHVHEFLIIHRK